jgi:DNA-binding NarL/FixJ family response regulator
LTPNSASFILNPRLEEAHINPANSGGNMKIVVVEDHPLMRNALLDTLSDLAPEAHLEGFSRLMPTKRWLQTNPDCRFVFVDLNLPDAESIHSLPMIRQEAPQAQVVVFSADESPQAFDDAMNAGAHGYITKSTGLSHLRQTLQEVLAGKHHCNGKKRQPELTTVPQTAAGHAPGSHQSAKLLTERQQEVLGLILRGYPNKLICRHLNLAEGTVKVHVSAVLKALGVRSRTEAVVAANFFQTQQGLPAELQNARAFSSVLARH